MKGCRRLPVALCRRGDHGRESAGRRRGSFHVRRRVYQVTGLTSAAAPKPPIWVGSLGPKALAVNGRQACSTTISR